MRICLTTNQFPPQGKGGIPRQRYILAQALILQGHEVHVIMQGDKPGTTVHRNVIIHTISIAGQPVTFSEKNPTVNQLLTYSLAVQEKIRILNLEKSIDILDVPLWRLEGFVPIYANEMPVVLWLQTSLAQLVALDHRLPQGDEVGIATLEKESLKRAKGIIADSQSVLNDFKSVYSLSGLPERSRVVHLGIPDLPARRRMLPEERNGVEALIVGRLEKRKGTSLLFEVLPQLLRSEKRLQVRFIGADNSQWDGFYAQHQQSYVEYFHTQWPELHDRVIFEGSVSETRLVEAYTKADIMLIPSLYESFGLIYLEAMRASLPIITFDLGAAQEIFPQGEKEGALLVPSENSDALVGAIQDLIIDQKQRIELGMCGRERFLAAFLDSRMALDTAEYYHDVIRSYSNLIQKPRRIFQVMEALVEGDAVSSIALQNAEILRGMGVGGTILCSYKGLQPWDMVRLIDQFDPKSNAALIFHYWNFSNLENWIRNFQGPKAMHFHNITPPEYFTPGSPGYEATSQGYQQLPGIINQFGLLIGDSTYNLEVCRPFLDGPKLSIVVPPIIEAAKVRARLYDADLLARLSKQDGHKLLFVGRIVRNKRQDRLIELFDAYCRSVDRHACLYLVGGDQGDPQYRAELETLREKLASGDRIFFTGKVSDEALYSYYHAADVFICASEHEGFCVPLMEAMALDIPVIAYASAAVPETMGQSGLLVREWEPQQIVGQIKQVMNDHTLQEKILASQRENLLRFSVSVVRTKLSAVAHYLQSGKIDQSMFNQISPIF